MTPNPSALTQIRRLYVGRQIADLLADRSEDQLDKREKADLQWWTKEWLDLCAREASQRSSEEATAAAVSAA
jgi:hypothetical protein